MSILRECFAVRPVTAADQQGSGKLKRVLTAWSLTAIGLGATIGTGVFVLTGQVAANQAGPAITLSLLIAAFGSGLAALCYAELASFLPVPGSALSSRKRTSTSATCNPAFSIISPILHFKQFLNLVSARLAH